MRVVLMFALSAFLFSCGKKKSSEGQRSGIIYHRIISVDNTGKQDTSEIRVTRF